MTVFKRSSPSGARPLVAAVVISGFASSALAGALIISGPEGASPPAEAGATEKPAAAQLAPPAPPVELKKGTRVDQQLQAFAVKAGWSLVWDAPEFVLEQGQVLPGNFEESIEYFLRGANEAGVRLRAKFYRGNKTVRITEF